MSWFELAPKGVTALEERRGKKRLRRLSGEATQVAAVGLDIGIAWTSAMVTHAAWSGDASLLGSAGGSPLLGLTSGLLFATYHGLRGGYALPALRSAGRQARIVVEGWAFTFFVLGWIGYLIRAYGDFSRGSITLHFVFGLVVLLAAHGFGARWLARSLASEGVSLGRVAVVCVGDEREVEAIRRDLAAGGVEVVSCSAIAPDATAAALPDLCRSAAERVRAVLAETGIDAVHLFFPWRRAGLVEAMMDAVGRMAVPVFLFADRETATLIDRAELQIGTLRGFELQRAPLGRMDRLLKRTLDLVVAVTGLVVLAPLMGLTALAILIETGRPVLFRQARRGFGARPFRIYKFRSMTVQENGAVVPQATRGDARVTRLGRLLRRSSIDELPQLFNVIAGDMSIVGPRPHAIAHDDYYDELIETYAFRQHVKPGITGWAQINGHRGETREVGQMSSRVEHDLWYIDNWSIWLDLMIVFRTAFRIFNDERAY